MNVKCNKCGHVADESEFPKGRDFFQHQYIAACADPDCDNRQSPGEASFRMGGGDRPFEYVRKPETSNDSLAQTLHRASEAS